MGRFVAPGLVCLIVRLSAAQGGTPAFEPVTDAMLQNPPAADWLMWRRTFDAWGYSPLDQINSRSVSQLAPVWSTDLGAGLQETTPLVYRGVMYIANPRDIIRAHDATTGKLLWEYKREWPTDVRRYVGVPDAKRNIAIYDDLIISVSADAVIFAIKATTGTLVWETKVQDYHLGVQHTSGAIIADGKVILGRSCFRATPDACVITAHDARTGKEAWRTRTIPMRGEPGDESWGGVETDRRLHVGTWMPPSFDAGLGLLYFGTSVTSPAPKFMLAGNGKTYLYHNSTLAIDVNTGAIRWFYQHVVDHWDMDHTFERLLVDTDVAPDSASVPWRRSGIPAGQRRRVVTGIPGKTGIVYTLDRATGEFLWARPTVLQNIVKSIDGRTGAVVVDPAVQFDKIGDARRVCPSSHGGRDMNAGAYSPLTNAMYFPLQNTCMVTTAIDPKTRGDSLYSITREFQLARQDDSLGTVEAISVKTGATLWKRQQRSASTSTLATAGALLFVGDAGGGFRALDQVTGKVLWETNLGAPVAGFPITYAVAGRQYVAVGTGSSIHTAVFASLAHDQQATPGNRNKIIVFALPASK